MATIRQRGNSYQIRVSCGTDIYSKKIVESMTWKPDENMTPRQIEKELNRVVVHFEENVKKGIVKSNKKIKMHEFCDIYLEMQKKTLSPTSYHVYQNIINTYIVPALGHLKLSDITPLHLQKFIYALTEHKTNQNKPLNPSTIRNYYKVVQSIFKFACRMKFLDYNPSSVDNLDLPKTLPAHTDIFDEKEISLMLDYLEKEPIMWKILIHLALCTGCRRGELAALQWDDIIWEKKQIQISKSLYSVNGEKNIKFPKTKNSNRVIAIPDYMIQMLRQYKIWQTEQTLVGYQKNLNDMLFLDKNSDFLASDNISRWFENFLERNNMPHIKFHALRHTSATLLLASGTNIKTVSSRLGHASIVTTNRYVHAMTEADKTAAETLEQKLNFRKGTIVGQNSKLSLK